MLFIFDKLIKILINDFFGSGPRLDITSTSPANYGHNSEDDQPQRTTQQKRHVRHENHHFSHHNSDTNSAVTLLRNNLHVQQSDHLHRDNSRVVEET